MTSILLDMKSLQAPSFKMRRTQPRLVVRSVWPFNAPPPMEHLSTQIQVPEVLNAPALTETKYSDFIKQVEQNKILNAMITRDQSRLKAETKDGQEELVILPENYDTVELLLSKNVNVGVKFTPTAPEPMNMSNIFVMIGELLMVYAIFSIGFSLLRNNTNGIRGFGSMSDKEINMDDKTGITFNDVGGANEAKESLQEIVTFLKSPEKYTEVGAKIPRGVLLYGPPGCSKTLLARAVAGEAGVPFFSCSGSEFIEMFVGVGASRVRDLFKKAKEKAPCIVFIDEIDAIGKSRSSINMGPGNDERDQTINQLLTQMDGFQGNNGVIVMGATNRPDILDAALLRPGRFDRRIAVDLPDFAGRKAIFDIHTRKKPLDDGVSLESFARITVGFSGADIESLCNEAAIYAARENRKKIIKVDFEMALEKSILGEEKRSVLLTDQKKKVLAYHEAGHALLGLLVQDYDTVRKVSIVPRGMTGGATYFEPSDEHIDLSLMTREYMESKIIVAFGGRIAEELIFGTMKITTGASGDLQAVYQIARDMIAQYGFNETLGPASWASAEGVADDMNKEIRFLVESLYKKAKDLMVQNESYLHSIANALIERETLSYEDLLCLVHGIDCPVVEYS
jgi:cell division protease FtsH